MNYIFDILFEKNPSVNKYTFEKRYKYKNNNKQKNKENFLKMG